MNRPDGRRPLWHFTPEENWLNDPNGFSFYGGRYHLFYQHNPYGTDWGHMSWGHAVSDDLLTWEHLPLALVRDRPYDEEGVFSGSAIELGGRHIVYYTGVAGPERNGEQAQCLAFSDDGIHYAKSGGNPILRGDGLSADRKDFRDPKVWAEGNTLRMLAATKDSLGGKINIYEADINRPADFALTGEIRREGTGYMWECPDYFTLDGMGFLLFSAMGVGLKKGLDQDNLSYISRLKEKNLAGRLIADPPERMDWGTDFYAPQSMNGPGGKRIVIGWLRMEEPLPGCQWTGMMSLPREAFLREGEIHYRPVLSPSSARTAETPLSQTGDTAVFAYDGESVYDIRISPGANEDVHLSIGDGSALSVSCSCTEGNVTLRRRNGRGSFDYYACPAQQEKASDIRVILDNSVCEAFVEEGRRVISAVFCGSPESNRIVCSFSGGESAVEVIRLRKKY